MFRISITNLDRECTLSGVFKSCLNEGILRFILHTPSRGLNPNANAKGLVQPNLVRRVWIRIDVHFSKFSNVMPQILII